jgi:hypothetical protein
MWLLAVLSLSLPVAIWGPTTTVLQGGVVGISAVSLLISSLRGLRGSPDSQSPLLWRGLQASGGLLIALLFARCSLGTFVPLPLTQARGLDALAVEAKFFAGVVLAGATAIGSGAVGDVLWRKKVAATGRRLQHG